MNNIMQFWIEPWKESLKKTKCIETLQFPVSKDEFLFRRHKIP